MKLTTLQPQLEQAWRLRMDQRIEEAQRLFLQVLPRLQAYAGAALLEPPAEAGEEEVRLLADAALLSGALDRARRGFEQARGKLAAAARFLESRSVYAHDLLAHERGLTALMDGQYFEALTHFQQAEVQARNPRIRSYALMNVALCMENLALDAPSTIRQLKLVLAELPEAENIPVVDEQLRAYERRLAFRRGEIAHSLSAESDSSSQSEYHRLWIERLPFHATSSAANAVERFARASNALHQGSYFSRTLLGLIDPQDLQGARLSSVADRVYLWTWLWLADPENFPANRIVHVLQSVSLEDAHRLTHEDAQMIRNALLWLGLFGYSGLEEIRTLSRRLKSVTAPDYPLYELERLVIEYFVLLRDRRAPYAQELLRTIGRHPLLQSPELRFEDLLDSVQEDRPLPKSHPLHCLAANIRGLARGLPASSADADESASLRIVDERKGLITDASGKMRVLSPLMVAAAKVLRAQPIVSQEDFVARVFGYYAYDPTRHDRAIFNLLARLKRTFPGTLDARVKAGRIVCDADWNLIRLVEASTPEAQLKDNAEWKGILKSGVVLMGSRPASASVADFDELVQRWISRRELEAALKRPRSTVNRVIERLCAEGLAKKRGQGRSTQYFLLSKSKKFLNLHSDSNPKGVQQ